MADSSCKCNTLGLTEDFGGGAIGEAFAESIIQLAYRLMKCPLTDGAKIAVFRKEPSK